MRILMLISELGYGGAESAFVRLARELSARHQVALVVFRETYEGGGYTATALPQGLAVHRLDSAEAEGRAQRWLRRLRDLRRLKRSFGADATISFLTGPNFLNTLSGGRGAAVVSVRGSRLHDAHSGALKKLWYRWFLDPITYGRADGVVCVSQGLTREVAGRRADTPGSKFVTISGYVDPDELIAASAGPVEPELERLAGEPLIVAAGRLSPEKGFHHLIRIFAAVRKRIDGAKLLLIGDGPSREELERACATLGLNHGDAARTDADVIFLGYRPAPNRYFRLGKLFVLASASEGFPNILVEALAAGIPVAAADVPWGTREVMGLDADRDNNPYPRSAPVQTSYGMLMPRIDDPAYERHWVEVLEQGLRAPAPGETDIGIRQARVRELGCASAAAKWEELLGRLAAAPGTSSPATRAAML